LEIATGLNLLPDEDLVKSKRFEMQLWELQRDLIQAEYGPLAVRTLGKPSDGMLTRLKLEEKKKRLKFWRSVWSFRWLFLLAAAVIATGIGVTTIWLLAPYQIERVFQMFLAQMLAPFS
jgi:hypothetical protein